MGPLKQVFLLSLLTLAIFTGFPSLPAQASCETNLNTALNTQPQTPKVRALQDIKKLRVMTFNVNNLFTSDMDLPPGTYSPGIKSQKEIDRLRKVIEEANPDFAVFTEVQDKDALDAIAKGYPSGDYQSYIIKGNDERGINIGFVVKGDLPFHIEEISHKDVTWSDPIENKIMPLFSRDLPVLVFRTDANAKPFLILFGNHAKSQRNRQQDKRAFKNPLKDPKSSMWRTAQYKGAAEIVEKFRKLYGPDVPMIFAGDENTNVAYSDELAPLWTYFVDSFNKAPDTIPLGPQRTTFTFHPLIRWRPKVEGVAVWNQLDAILFSKEFAKNLISAKIYRYKDDFGNVIRLPERRAERDLNPSDHYPIIVDFKTDSLF